VRPLESGGGPQSPRHSANVAFLVGFALLALPTGLLLFDTLGFFLGFAVSGAASLFAVAGAAAATWRASVARLGGRPVLVLSVLALALATVLLSLDIAAACYDLSADGQFYHQEAIIQLAQGWNPLHGSPMREDEGAKLWVEHYPRGAWICAASVYQAFGRIEAAKCFNVTMVVAAFCLALHALLSYGVGGLSAVLLALLAALNPVSTCQLLGFYIDGQMAALLTILTATALTALRACDVWISLVMAMAALLVVNLKFTGGAYAVAILASAALWLLWRRRRVACRSVSLALACGLLVGVLVVGYSPYVTNLRDHGHPFYPVAGPDAVDIMTGASPVDVLGRNRLGNLAVSLFAQSANDAPNGTLLKWPFAVSRQELQTFDIPDTRIGGFGPWFGGSLLLGVTLLVAASFDDRRTATGILGVSTVVVGSALMHPHGWWARYAPQIWLVPLLIAAGTMGLRSRACFWLRCALLAAITVDVAMVGTEYVGSQIDGTRSLREELLALRKGPLPVSVRFREFRSNRIRLDEFGLPYRELRDAEDLPCGNPTILEGYTARICPGAAPSPAGESTVAERPTSASGPPR
jgi:hypothetical protein